MTTLRAVPPPPPPPPPRPQRGDVVARLSENDIQSVYRAIGIQKFKPGGPNDWKVFVPWRENRNTEAMTIRKSDGVWSDKATGERGSIFDAVERGGLSGAFPASLDWVVAHLGYAPPTPAPARPEPTQAPIIGRRHEVTHTSYVYTDAEGQPLYAVEREDYADDDGVMHKEIWQSRFSGGSWRKGGASDEIKTLYNLPLLADPANARKPVYLVEGEKCADAAVRALGIVATTVVGGTSGWRDKYSYQLAGRDVVILVDNDEPGWKYGLGAASSLAGRARSLKVLALPGLGPTLPSGGLDIVDWLERGHGLDEFLQAVADAPEYEPVTLPPLMVSLWELWQHPPPRPPQLIAGVWEPSSFGMIAAHAKSYKGFFVIDFLASLASGSFFLGHGDLTVLRPARVVYWLEEGAAWDILRRLGRWCEARQIIPGDWMQNVSVVYGAGLRVSDSDGLARLRAEIEAFRPDVVICDTLSRVAAGVDENTSEGMGMMIDLLDGIKRDYDVAAIYVHHLGKSGSYRGHSSLYAACDCIANLERERETNRLTIEFELKSGHQHDPLLLELIDDVQGNGALFLVDPLRARSPLRGVAPSHEAALRYIHRYGWVSHAKFKEAHDRLPNAVYDVLRTELMEAGLVAEHTQRPSGALGGRPVVGLNLCEKGLRLIGVLDDD